MNIKREVAWILNKIVRQSLEYFYFSTLAAVRCAKFYKRNFQDVHITRFEIVINANFVPFLVP